MTVTLPPALFTALRSTVNWPLSVAVSEAFGSVAVMLTLFKALSLSAIVTVALSLPLSMVNRPLSVPVRVTITVSLPSIRASSTMPPTSMVAVC